MRAYSRRLCIYCKRVLHTFLQRMGWHAAWLLGHFRGVLRIWINHIFRYLLGPSWMSRACIQKFKVWKMTLCVPWQPQIQSIQEEQKYDSNWAKWSVQWWCEVGIHSSKACLYLDSMLTLTGILSKLAFWIEYAGRCYIWHHHTRQDSGSQVTLNFVAE